MKKLPLLKKLLLTADLLLIPALFLCKVLTDVMLSHVSICPWNLFGGKCVTCGGTHFVNTLLSGNIVAAYYHNQFLFVMSVLLGISYVLLHLYLLGNVRWARWILVKVYSIPGLILTSLYMMAFLVARNIEPFTRIAEHFFG